MQDTMEHGEDTSGILKDVASKWNPLKSGLVTGWEKNASGGGSIV